MKHNDNCLLGGGHGLRAKPVKARGPNSVLIPIIAAAYVHGSHRCKQCGYMEREKARVGKKPELIGGESAKWGGSRTSS